MTQSWDADTAGIMRLPSGALVRGRGLRRPVPVGLDPQFGVYLLGKQPPPVEWDSTWIRWRDFWLPSDRGAFRNALTELLERARSERVEIACYGGVGRTGTAMACLAVLDGVSGDEAVDYVRTHYSHRAVETPWQRRFVVNFG
ncbi:protein phosphatase [Micromonospora sp. R77]|uniref:protein-tyrosine phosphatase family protein n=1 Tax=Micromonospora sp. R77 TaxID=2925836 RepID=UPI001F622A59|nr:protein-tyrosine phosphatase family protein [Micromonospora sp. R77]MCI4066218.1 protein phosphatase [Micromonospora sp. R77]